MSSRHSPTRASIRSWPLIAALGVFAVLFLATTLQIWALTDRHLTYALDDAYIHMAIAKNVALHGNWGVRADTFASTSSSPLWTTLLALAFAVAGVRESLPLLLNLGLAAGCLVSLWILLDRVDMTATERTATIAAVIFFTPLVPMVWIGMEHTMQVLLTILTAFTAIDLARREPNRASLIRLCALAGLLTATRYEGMFVLVGCAVVLVRAGRRTEALATMVAGVTPIIGLGLWYTSHGWFLLPASVMMKQGVLPPRGASVAASLIHNVAHAEFPAALVTMVGAAVVLIVLRRALTHTEEPSPLLLIFIVSALQQALLARFGQLFRYEAALVALGVCAIGIAASSLHASVYGRRPEPLLVYGCLFVSLVTFAPRTLASNVRVAVTAGHIYRQQRQVARFIGRYYADEAVALNDIGAVSYFTHARVSDLMGLSSLDAAIGRRQNQFDGDHINSWLAGEDARIAIIYDEWFQGEHAFQKSWNKVATWTTDDPSVVEGRVTFYARDEAARDLLRARLDAFSADLPAGTRQTLFGQPSAAALQRVQCSDIRCA